MFKKVLLGFIFLFAIIYIFNIGIKDSEYIMLFKLLPMIFIIIYALLSKALDVKKYYILMTIGLVVCAVGDYTIQQWFIVGLSFFLIGHIFYISAFITATEQKSPKSLLAGLLVYGAVMAAIIAGGLFKDGDTVLALAVIAYISVILTMGWTAWRTKSIFAMIGAFLFIISDSVLALNKFTIDIPYSGIWIMSTYYGAQILLALSISQYSVFRNKMIQ